MGISGRRWRLPGGDAEVEARAKLLAALGLSEQAVVDAPPSGQRDQVLSELWPAERTWLVEFAGRSGLTRNPSPGRALRVLVRAAIANRDLLPIKIEIDPAPLWLVENQPPSLRERLDTWLAVLPDDVLSELSAAVRDAQVRRKKKG